MEKLNKLSLPATILIASLILGGFYYASEANKSASIEKQQQVDLQAKTDADKAVASQQALEAYQKSLCVSEAEQNAQDYYKANCAYDCKAGQYYIATYDANYSQCLQRAGLK